MDDQIVGRVHATVFDVPPTLIPNLCQPIIHLISLNFAIAVPLYKLLFHPTQERTLVNVCVKH